MGRDALFLCAGWRCEALRSVGEQEADLLGRHLFASPTGTVRIMRLMEEDLHGTSRAS
jgi:hypothetical protein